MRRHQLTMLAVMCIAAGVVLRVGYAVRCGVGYDEVFVMGVGLDEVEDSPGDLAFSLPIRRSDGVTPLWWWVQAIPIVVRGDLSLAGLRVLPVLFGAATLVLTWWIAARRVGRGPAWILVAMAAFSDVLALTNARGEFADSLLIAAALPAVCLVGDWRRPGLKGACWLIILMTHLGKGLVLVGGLAAAEALVVLADRTRRGAGRRLAFAAFVAVAPTVLWLLATDRVVFSAGPVATDAGVRDNVWHALTAITFDYRQTKQHMIAGPLDAAQVYLDGVVWPATTILAVPLLVGVAQVVGWLWRRRVRGRRRVLALALLPWAVTGVLVVVGRGLVGARFHLLYLPAVWLIAAVGLWQLRHMKRSTLAVCGALWALHVGLGFSWSSWSPPRIGLSVYTALGIGAVVVPIALSMRLRSSLGGRWGPGLAVVGAVLVAGLLLGGPWRWGPAARMEPMAGPAGNQGADLLASIDRARTGQGDYPPPHGRTLYIDLANYFLTKDSMSERDAARAVHYAELETRCRPNDARAWFYLGLAYQRAGRPTDQVRQAWQTCYDLKPDPRVAQRLRQLDDQR